MPGWIEAVIVIGAAAIVLQTIILGVTFLSVRALAERTTKFIDVTQAKVEPILTRATAIIEVTETRVSSILADATEISHLSRTQVQKVDRVLTDAVERLRVQIERADQIITGTLEVIEDAGTRIKKTVWEPVNQASALIKGLKAGLDSLIGRTRNSDRESATEDEELFI